MRRTAHATALAMLMSASAFAACSPDDAAPTENRRPPPPPEAPNRIARSPEGWNAGGSSSAGNPAFGLDYTVKRSGSASAYMSASYDPSNFIMLSQFIRADDYRGKRVRWSGWVRHSRVVHGAGLWMRVDAHLESPAFDNMMDSRALMGDSDWRHVSIVLDVPAHAIGISLGALVQGSGELMLDDLQLEVVGTDVPSTNLFTTPAAHALDSMALLATYAPQQFAPQNLDFEGIAALGNTAVDWLRTNSEPLQTTDPRAALDDLERLGEMVGDARIVGLGEGTHGSREFFLLKHRFVRFLVEQLGFTHFAIEASWPESNDVNRYVLTGEGDPAQLLRNLYFWTWNTEEVLDLIGWIRQWNASAPPERRVQFVGVDMQHPGAAMDSVLSYVERVAPASAQFVRERYACLEPYRNHGARRGQPELYAAVPSPQRAACGAAVRQVHDLVRDQRDALIAASSEPAHAMALRSARLVVQFEAANATPGAYSAVRDSAMAENASWWLERAGPGSRIALWAHNAHVSNVDGWMGAHLRRAHGAKYLALGFLFGDGSFNATSPSTPLQSWTAGPARSFSLEAAFQRTSRVLVLFDARRLDSGGVDVRQLRGPIAMRSIGAIFVKASEQNYVQSVRLPRDYDLLAYVGTTTPTRLRP